MDCYDLCKQEHIENVCNCYQPSLLRVTNDDDYTTMLLPCTSEQNLECVDKLYLEAFGDTFNTKCNEKCPLECDKMIFSTVYSQLNKMSKERARLYYVQSKFIRSQIQPAFIANNNNKNDDDDDDDISLELYDLITRSIVRFNVFYDSLSLLEVNEKPNFTIVDLISSMGGTFGLFLGISILSLLELVEFVYEVAFESIRTATTSPTRKSNRSKIANKTNVIIVKPRSNQLEDPLA
jgi:hypothetical protein